LGRAFLVLLSAGHAAIERKAMRTVLIDAALDLRMRTWLATTLGASAQWRINKANEYRDDPRNANSASALLQAVTYVRQKNGAGISQMIQLFAACEEIDFELVTFAGPKSERVAGRYGFDHESLPVDDASHNELLQEIFVASLEDLRDGLEDDIPLESQLAEMIRNFVPQRAATPERATIVLLTEIRDLLRDRLPVAVETPVES
jgi:hypothetical protein